jgi:hypothetical protein
VLEKLAWLQNWLNAAAPGLGSITAKYIWIASGRVAITANSPQRRRIAQSGLDFCSHLNLDQLT